MTPFWTDILIRAVGTLFAFAVMGWFYGVYVCFRNAWRAYGAEAKLRWGVTGAALLFCVPVFAAHLIEGGAS